MLTSSIEGVFRTVGPARRCGVRGEQYRTHYPANHLLFTDRKPLRRLEIGSAHDRSAQAPHPGVIRPVISR